MLRLRRSTHEPRLELTPMIDVIFLLLTFFIYATILMVRAEILPMNLRSFQAGEAAKPQAVAVISIDLGGRLYLDREPVELTQLRPKLLERHAAEPATVVYLAVADGASTVDRAPLLQDIWDLLKDAGLELNLVGRPKDAGVAPGTGPAAR